MSVLILLLTLFPLPGFSTPSEWIQLHDPIRSADGVVTGLYFTDHDRDSGRVSGTKDNGDLNAGVRHSKFLYLNAPRNGASHEGICELFLSKSRQCEGKSKVGGYTDDLNYGTGKANSEFFMCYSKCAGWHDSYISEMKLVNGGCGRGWVKVTDRSGQGDLNFGAGGDDIFLCVKQKRAFMGDKSKIAAPYTERSRTDWIPDQPKEKDACKEWSDTWSLRQFNQKCEKGEAMQGFSTNEGGCSGEQMRWAYRCKYLGVSTSKLQQETFLSSKTMGNGKISQLVNAEMTCWNDKTKNWGVISSYQFKSVDSGHNYKWAYTCDNVKTGNCHQWFSQARDNGNHKVDLLKGQDVKCPRDEFLSFLSYRRVNDVKYRWEYFCCQTAVSSFATPTSSHYGTTAVMWTQESNIGSGSLTFKSSWSSSKQAEKSEENSNEFSSTIEEGWNAEACVMGEFGYSWGTEGVYKSDITVGFETCAKSTGSKSATETSSSMVGKTIATGTTVGKEQTCTIEAPSYCKHEGCSIWRWTVSRNYLSVEDEYTTLRTCLVQFQRGEWKHMAPNCVPDQCAEGDKSCLTCKDPTAQFLPLAALVDEFHVCPMETCKFIPADTCPETVEAVKALIDCSKWRKLPFGSETNMCRAAAATAVLPEGTTVSGNPNCHGGYVYEHRCERTSDPDAFDLRSEICPFSEVIGSLRECEEAAHTLGYPARAKVVHNNQPLGCYVNEEDKVYYNTNTLTTRAKFYELKFGAKVVFPICRSRVEHVHGETVTDYRRRHCVNPKQHAYGFAQSADSIRDLIQSREECVHAAHELRLTNETRPSSEPFQFLKKMDIDVSNKALPSGCLYRGGNLMLNLHPLSTPQGEGMIVRKGLKKETTVSCFTKKYEKKYLAGHAQDAKKCTGAQTQNCGFLEATAYCKELGLSKCGGVTRVNVERYTVRAGSELINHADAEGSWKADDCKAQNEDRVWEVSAYYRQEGRCTAPVGVILGITGYSDCSSKALELGAAYFQYQGSEKKCEWSHTTSHTCPEGWDQSDDKDSWRFYSVNNKVEVGPREPECNPNKCSYGALACYGKSSMDFAVAPGDPSTCGTSLLSDEATKRKNQLEADCYANPNSNLCKGNDSPWDDCGAGSNNNRFACPLGTWTCGDLSCGQKNLTVQVVEKCSMDPTLVSKVSYNNVQENVKENCVKLTQNLT